MAPQLCGSHLAFYACLHRADRGGAGRNADCAPCVAGYSPGHPYRCLAPAEAYAECPSADRTGARHRAAGIVIPIVQEARHAAA